MMRAGFYRPVHVKTLRSQKLRMLLTHRKLLQSKAIAIENDLRGTLRNFGLKVGMVETARFEARIKELVENFPDLAVLVEPLLIVRRILRNSRAVGAVLGLTPCKYQSGESDYTGGISRCGDEMMRVMLYEAAQILLMRSTQWSWLKAWAMQIARRRGVKKAIVALARRLAVIMHRIWIDGTEFRWTREGVAAA